MTTHKSSIYTCLYIYIPTIEIIIIIIIITDENEEDIEDERFPFD